MDRAEAAPWLAANKLGLGLRPGEYQTIAADPRGWLREQLPTIASLPQALADIGSSADLLVQERALQQRINTLLRTPTDPVARPALRQARAELRAEQLRQGQARMRAAIDSQAPYAERLVRFWSNHFTVSLSGKPPLRWIALPYENSAIRASLAGSFEELLLAVCRHPAMLFYLDNVSSVGPASQRGRASGRGLNENFGRELLELHTLGVQGGYTQQDVRSLAAILSGWHVDQRWDQVGKGPARPGAFRFAAGAHEPGPQRVLGKSYDHQGVDQGEQALRDIARHPATARHLAQALVKHFIADEPPPRAVAVLESVFMASEGWLPALHQALIELDDTWNPGLRKLKSPEDFVVSTARACGLPAAASKPELVLRVLDKALQVFGQQPFTASSPAGWPDTAVLWGSPDALLKRIEWINALVRYFPADIDPRQLREQVIPRYPALWQEIDAAESPAQALVLLLAGPAFQWRGV